MLVVLDQSRAGEAGGKLLNDFFDLIVLQPWIDDPEPFSQHRQHNDFGKVLPEGVAVLLPDKICSRGQNLRPRPQDTPRP